MQAFVMALLMLTPLCVVAADAQPKPPVWKTLAPFKDLAEFNDYRQKVREAARARRLNWGTLRRDSASPLHAQLGPPCDPTVADCEPYKDEDADKADVVVVTGFRASLRSSQDVKAAASITNNQEANVDEGDIVKAYDRFLVVLMHGRLFSIDTGADARGLKLVDRIDTYQKADDESWIDEMLITGDKLIVTGYSYETSSTNYSVFSISKQGRLAFVARYFVESDDYYSWENYASRVVDGKLVVYLPFDLSEYGANQNVSIPRIRRWTEAQGFSEWQPIFRIDEIYRPVQTAWWPTLHVITFCELDAGGNQPCRARGIVGPWQRETYVTPDNYYLWLTTDSEEIAETRKQKECADGEDNFRKPSHPSTVFRLTLDRLSLTAAHTEGWPSDQFALEEHDGDLWALLKRPPAGCRDWEYVMDKGAAGYPLALARVPQELFSPRPEALSLQAYYRVPPIRNPWAQQTRFSEHHVIYGAGVGYWDDELSDARDRQITVIRLTSPRLPRTLPLPHNVTRVELFGDAAVAFGHMAGGDFAVSSIALKKGPRIVDTQVVPGVIESEGRSHAYNASVERDGSGIFGLPTSDLEEVGSRYWRDVGVDVRFFAAGANLQLEAAGALEGAEPGGDTTQYSCEVSCYDWYGNARPIFFRGRVFALIGLELVEGAVGAGGVHEIARLPLNRRPR